MSAKKVVNSDLFITAANGRAEEQKTIEESIKKKKPKMVGRGRPAKSTESTITVTIRMTEDRKQKLKEYAVKNRRTVSDVIAEFIDGLD